ncbi:hypothetical protein M8N38_22005, partial [Enterobacter asburiae]|nr:hypothetical protein [Enterobacter asburiae]
MKRVIVAGTILLLAGCSINRQAEVSSRDAPNGIVRLDYGQAALQNAYSDEGNDSKLLIVFYVQIMPDDFIMQLHR